MDVANSQVVEFVENQRFFTAMCIGKKANRYHLITYLGREINLPESRFLHISPQRIKSNARSACLQELQGIFIRREELKAQIDIQYLWELIKDERGTWSLHEIADLAFSEDTGPDHEVALIRAVIEDHLYFKFREGVIYVQPKETIERLLSQQALEQKKLERIKAGLDWLGRLWPKPAAGSRDLKDPNIAYWVDAIGDFCIRGEESNYTQEVRDLFKQAGITEPSAPFNTLVRAGIWSEDENVELIRFGIETSFPEDAMGQAADIASSSLDTNRAADLTGLDIFTIDGPETTDIDDALSFERLTGGYEIGVHITDIGLKIKSDTPLFENAISRATTIYLPDLTVSMLPDILSSDALSLSRGEYRRALSFLIRLDKNGNILKSHIVRSAIRVNKRMDYDEADLAIEEGGLFSEIHQLCKSLQAARIEKGALPLPIPELMVKFDPGRGVTVKLSQPGPARFLVSECMILANTVAANFLKDNRIPALYKSQPPPREQIISGIETNLKANFRQRRLISKGNLGQKPEGHHGLGLDAYTTITSPLRRGLDLVMQQQLDSFISNGEPMHDAKGLEKIAITLQQGLAAASAVKQIRTRYFLLKHMQGLIDVPLDAWILEPNHQKVLAVLNDYLMPVELPRRPNAIYSPDQDIKVRLKKVNARENILKVDWYANRAF